MIPYISNQPGSGKTHYMINEIIKTHQNVKHVITQPTVKLQDETENALKVISEHVKVLNTDNKNGNLLKDIRTALRDSTVRVLLITEAMFYLLEPSELLHVKIWMDDCIQFSSNYFSGISVDDYEQWSNIYSNNIFEVTKKINEDFNEVIVKEPSYEMSDDTIRIIENITFKMRSYNKLAVNKDYINNPPVSNEQKRFVTLVGWHDLSVYQDHNIIFMANNFESSLLYKYNHKYFYKVDFKGKEDFDESRLDVRFFVPSISLKFGLTKAYTESVEGKKLVSKAVGYINENEKMFYCTENIDCPKLNGDYYPPLLRGVNTLTHYSTAVFFSCMNATPIEMITYKKLFGFSSLDLKSERELEVMHQFCARGVMRLRDVDTKMTIYVLSEDQALYLSESPTYIDVNLLHKKATKPGPQPKLDKVQQLAWNAYKTQYNRMLMKEKKPETIEEFIERMKFNDEITSYINIQFEKFIAKQNKK